MDDAIWIKNILDLVWEFSSEDFQTRAWLKGTGPEESSFVEADCGFFDDNIADDLIDMKWRQVGLTLKQRDKLATFRDALKKFNQRTNAPERSHRDILTDSEWPKIRQLAKEVLESFKGSKWEHKQAE
jgi:hypothetical protein